MLRMLAPEISREAVETFVETERTARRVLGSAHPIVAECEEALRDSREALATREAPVR